MPMKSNRSRFLAGFALAPILCLALACVLLAFTVAGIATFQLGAATRLDGNERALTLAEAVIAQAMDHLHGSLVIGGTPYGGNTSPYDSITYAPYPERPDATGQL